MTFSDFLTMPIPDGREGKMLELYVTKDVKEEMGDDGKYLNLTDPIIRVKYRWAPFFLDTNLASLEVIQIQGSIDPNVLKILLDVPDEEP